MILKATSNQSCGRDSEYIIGAFLKSFSILDTINSVINVVRMTHATQTMAL